MLFFKRYKIKRLDKKIKAMQHNRLHNPVSSELQQKEVSLYLKLADLYNKLKGHKKYPFAYDMYLECYRAAANIEDAGSQYILGKELLEKAKFRHQLQAEGLFASDSNEKRMKMLYGEALAYLTAAEQQDHIQAKRLHGLCYINGWGVEQDKRTGFDLVVASIEQENSWDKVPQIFAAMGLNKPEFFSALSQHRNQS